MLGTTGQYLGYALEKKYITINELYSTDENVLNVIKKHHQSDEYLKKLFDRMNLKYSYQLNSLNFDLKIGCKNRNINPLFLDNSQVKKLSAVDLDWERTISNTQPIVYYIKFLE